MPYVLNWVDIKYRQSTPHKLPSVVPKLLPTPDVSGAPLVGFGLVRALKAESASLVLSLDDILMLSATAEDFSCAHTSISRCQNMGKHSEAGR